MNNNNGANSGQITRQTLSGRGMGRLTTRSLGSLFVLLILALPLTASAKKQPTNNRVYVFGFAASFTDTIVHFTPIQQLDSITLAPKTRFLKDREEYSIQLREYLGTHKDMPHRTCVVFYDEKPEKLQKKYDKMKKLYTRSKDGQAHFDVRYIKDDEFKFRAIKNE